MRSQSGCTTQPHTPAAPPLDPPQAFAQRPALDETHGQARIVHLLLQYQQLVVQQPSATVTHASQQSQGNSSDPRQQSETEEAAAHGYDAVAVRAITAHLPRSIEKPTTKSCMGSWANEMPHKTTVQSVSPSLSEPDMYAKLGLLMYYFCFVNVVCVDSWLLTEIASVQLGVVMHVWLAL